MCAAKVCHELLLYIRHLVAFGTHAHLAHLFLHMESGKGVVRTKNAASRPPR
jgi:hypothetical protein